METLKQWFPSKRLRITLAVVAALLVALLVFHAGMVVGSHRAFRSHDEWGFRGAGFSMRMPRGFMQNGHGAVGTIGSVAPSSLSLQTRDGGTEEVLLSPRTMIRAMTGDASSSALIRGERIIVLGVPTQSGAIAADVIRIMGTPSNTAK